MKRIGVFTSGGDSPGMNACIRAVVRAAIALGVEVVGIERGYEGMIDGQFRPLESKDVSGILQRGGTILRSARSARFMTPEGRKAAFENIKKAGVEGIVVIGGDGSFKGAEVFHGEYGVPMIGTPGTIDNDLYGTDYTIGYDTAVNTVMQAVDKLKDTAAAHDRLFVVEVMGRDAGFIALRSGIATGAEAILVPEVQGDLSSLKEKLDNNWNRHRDSAIIIVAEGDESGGAFSVQKMINAEYPDLETKVTILGHVQRGGSPTAFDRLLASSLGVAAVDALLAGKSNLMMGMHGNEVVEVPFEKAIKHNKVLKPQLLRLAEILSV